MGSRIHHTSGPALDKQGDVAAILTNLQANDVLFIDEIHRLNASVEEVLYLLWKISNSILLLEKGLPHGV